jgi:hypothetical protein
MSSTKGRDHAKQLFGRREQDTSGFLISLRRQPAMPRPRSPHLPGASLAGGRAAELGIAARLRFPCGDVDQADSKLARMEVLEIAFYVVMGVAGISIAACAWEISRWP